MVFNALYNLDTGRQTLDTAAVSLCNYFRQRRHFQWLLCVKGAGQVII